MINLPHFPLLLGGLLLSFSINNCPAAPGRADLSSIALAAEEGSPKAETSADRSNLFGISLLVKLMKATSEENIVISPFSLELALAMVYVGCSGTSADELSRVVGFTPQIDSQKVPFPGMALRSDLPPTLKIANSLWCDRSTKMRPIFKEKVKGLFDPEIQSRDLESVDSIKAINDWVARATEGRITDLIQKPPKPPLLLIDAVYFKGSWEHAFSTAQNFPSQFNREHGGPCQVTMMKRSLSAPYLETEDFQAIKLPYNGGRLEMLLILPAEATGLAAVLQRLSNGSWKPIVDEFSEASGTISLPRFKVTYRDSLVSPLTQLGIKAVFEPSNDFTPMFEDTRKFYVSDIIQQTYLRVDENGTEAAAATGVQVGALAIPLPAKKPFDLVFDRPFLFAIVDDESGQLIFAGVLRDPDQAKL